MTLFWWEMTTIAITLLVCIVILVVEVFIRVPLITVVFNYLFRQGGDMKKIKYRIIKKRTHEHYEIQIRKCFVWKTFEPQNEYTWKDIGDYYLKEESCHEVMKKLFGKQIAFITQEWEIV